MANEEHPLYDDKAFARLIEGLILGGSSSQEVSDFFCDDSYLSMIQPYQNQTPLHIFIGAMVDIYLYEETTAADLNEMRAKVSSAGKRGAKNTVLLPIEMALLLHSVKDDGFKDFVTQTGKKFDEADEDDVYDYFQELRCCGTIEELGDAVAEKVFPILFTNLTVLGAFNEIVSDYVSHSRTDEIDTEYSLLFSSSGVLHAVPPPNWAKRLVFDREKGSCAACKCRLDTEKAHYHLVIPLASGGLNDVTNLQLRCDQCQASKL